MGSIAVTQTRLGSLIEAFINVLVGFTINYLANLLIFPLFGMHISLTDNILMGLIYTAISIVRSYTIRRWFNARIKTASIKISSRMPG